VLIGAVALVAGTLLGDSVNGAGGLALLAVGLAGRAVVKRQAPEHANREAVETGRAPL